MHVRCGRARRSKRGSTGSACAADAADRAKPARHRLIGSGFGWQGIQQDERSKGLVAPCIVREACGLATDKPADEQPGFDLHIRDSIGAGTHFSQSRICCSAHPLVRHERKRKGAKQSSATATCRPHSAVKLIFAVRKSPASPLSLNERSIFLARTRVEGRLIVFSCTWTLSGANSGRHIPAERTALLEASAERLPERAAKARRSRPGPALLRKCC